MLKGHHKYTLQPLQARTCQTKPISWAQLDARDCTATGARGGKKPRSAREKQARIQKDFSLVRQHSAQILHCLLSGCALAAALPARRRRLTAHVLQEQPLLEIEIPLPSLSKAGGGQWLTKGGEGPASGKPISFKNSCSAHPLHTVLTGAQSLREKQGEAGCTPRPGLVLGSAGITHVFPPKKPPWGQRDATREQRRFATIHGTLGTGGLLPAKGPLQSWGELEAALTPRRSSPALACHSLP